MNWFFKKINWGEQASYFQKREKFAFFRTSYVQWKNEKNSSHTVVWKFQDFSVIQILREIDFGVLENLKIAIFAILGAVKFVNLVNSGL